MSPTKVVNLIYTYAYLRSISQCTVAETRRAAGLLELCVREFLHAIMMPILRMPMTILGWRNEATCFRGKFHARTVCYTET